MDFMAVPGQATIDVHLDVTGRLLLAVLPPPYRYLQIMATTSAISWWAAWRFCWPSNSGPVYRNKMATPTAWLVAGRRQRHWGPHERDVDGGAICREKGIEYARRLLGHSNISTTQRYVHLDDGELADAQDLIE